jgi:hypothetical protein
MKKYKTIIVEGERTSPMSITDLFVLSDHISENLISGLGKVISRKSSVESKLASILSQKEAVRQIYMNEDFQAPLHNLYYLDGAIRLTAEDIDEIRNIMVQIVTDENGNERVERNSVGFDAYISDLLNDFAFQKGSELVFRNLNYYFLFHGIKIEAPERTTSINDYVLTDINIEVFCNELLANYNSISQHMMLFSSFFFAYLHAGLSEHKTQFCQEIREAISVDVLNKLQIIASEKTLHSGDKEFDAMYAEQWRKALDALGHLREVVNQYEKDEKPNSFAHMIKFLSTNTVAIERAKIEFGIDIDHIFNKYATKRPVQAMRKILMGLLDAKINILAFFQNFIQIICSDQFLNEDFSGSLVFSQSVVRHIKSVSGKEFDEFKNIQRTLTEDEFSTRLLREIDENVGFYMDTLFDDNYIGCVKLLAGIAPGLPEIWEGRTNRTPIELEGALFGLKALFSLLKTYVSACEVKEKAREAKKTGQGKKFQPSETHIRAWRAALKKLIRLYREENHPVLMVGTAQNALNLIMHKGFIQFRDVLHLMSVNYGGALIGSFAKHTFSRSIRHGRIAVNPGGLVYSIYDVKNANSFSGLTDYPFSRLLRSQSVEPVAKSKFAKRNWLLVFDDNTNSGQTLDDIRLLAEKTEFYSRVDLFPCRASIALQNYKRSMSDNQKLWMIVVAAAIAEKSKLNSKQLRYKEKVGTIIGNRMFKLLTAA